MLDRATILAELTKFGLSTNQAAVYLLLASHYELRIQEITELARIPRSSVYECLKELYRLGLAEEVIEGTFKKVRAYPIGAMRHGLDEQISSLQQLSADLDNLEQAIAVALPKAAQPSTVLRYYRGRAGARQLYWNTLKAGGMVYVYSDWVAESRTRNIQERVLMNPTARALESIRRYNIPLSPMARTDIKDIRYLPETSLLVTGDTLMYDNIYAQVYLNNHEINGFEIESRSFTESQRSIFATMWRMAEPLSDLLGREQGPDMVE